jgi:hypothetical protein
MEIFLSANFVFFELDLDHGWVLSFGIVFAPVFDNAVHAAVALRKLGRVKFILYRLSCSLLRT